VATEVLELSQLASSVTLAVASYAPASSVYVAVAVNCSVRVILIEALSGVMELS